MPAPYKCGASCWKKPVANQVNSPQLTAQLPSAQPAHQAGPFPCPPQPQLPPSLCSTHPSLRGCGACSSPMPSCLARPIMSSWREAKGSWVVPGGASAEGTARREASRAPGRSTRSTWEHGNIHTGQVVGQAGGGACQLWPSKQYVDASNAWTLSPQPNYKASPSKRLTWRHRASATSHNPTSFSPAATYSSGPTAAP